MDTPEPPKRERYRVVYYPTRWGELDYVTGEGQMNALAETGYKVKAVKDQFAVMELEEPSKYEDVDAVKQVPHGEVKHYVSNGEGWKIDSVYSKHTVLIRRKPLKSFVGKRNFHTIEN